jgi:hypothetical protein
MSNQGGEEELLNLELVLESARYVNPKGTLMLGQRRGVANRILHFV